MIPDNIYMALLITGLYGIHLRLSKHLFFFVLLLVKGHEI